MKKPRKKYQYLNLAICIISFFIIIYFFISNYINNKSISSLEGKDISYIILWVAVFFGTLFNSLKYFRKK